MGSAADSPRHSADADDGDNGSSKGRLVANLWPFSGPLLRSAALEGKGSGGELTILLRARNGIAPQQAKKSGQAFSANVFEASFWRKFWVLSKPFWARPLRGKDGSGQVSHPGGRPCSQLEVVCEVPDWRHTVTSSRSVCVVSSGGTAGTNIHDDLAACKAQLSTRF
jgi:hypothetical protein